MSLVYKQILDFMDKSPSIQLEKSSSPNVLTSKLPQHWRSNKSLQTQFFVVLLTPVPDNTLVSISAGNDETPCSEIRNETAKIQQQVASVCGRVAAKPTSDQSLARPPRIQSVWTIVIIAEDAYLPHFPSQGFATTIVDVDKRQDSPSRMAAWPTSIVPSFEGIWEKCFNLTITIHSRPLMVAMVTRVIKVTVDGPRDARIPKPITTLKRPLPACPPGPSSLLGTPPMPSMMTPSSSMIPIASYLPMLPAIIPQ
ncbi:unnamed protein product [Caenorhabditis auriculariae]|uniref:Runt domain-containing protein n=1 Tax=Caenorhabditis auriculariae TaxID=2777116 RepID=A0A8S1HPH0_9PELO|nr:unnamed protein product [Caenorhabditis auriculariae]